MKYLTIYNKDIEEYKKKLGDFYFPSYSPEYIKAIENTPIICVCFDGEVIVGAGRILTDFNRFAFFVDLNVSKSYRRRGIGTQLVKNMLNECLKINITRYIELSTDPKLPWLEEFYTKNGFSKDSDSTHMRYRPKIDNK